MKKMMVKRGRVLGRWLGPIGLTLILAGTGWAQSDTAEVRPSDLAPRKTSGGGAANSEADAAFAQEKESVRANIELWESRIRTKMADVDQVLKGLDVKKIEGQRIAIGAIDELLQAIDEEAQAILEAQERVAPDLKLYRQALLKAPDVFRQCAAKLDERAEGRKSMLLKEAYADFAAEARKLAGVYEAKAKSIDALEASIAQKMEFVVESREFIQDARELLAAIPTDNGLQTEKMVARLNKYLEVFQEAIKTIRGVTEQIGDSPTAEPRSPAAVKPPRTLSQQTPDRPAAPLSIAQYRASLAALKR